jgi:hypothetical protein
MKGLPPDQRESVDLILQAGRHLLGLINTTVSLIIARLHDRR